MLAGLLSCCKAFHTFRILLGGRNLLVLEAGVEGPPISEEDTDTFTFLNDEIAIPAIQTYYNCKLFEFPRFSTKRHVIQVRL